ncbi:MAG TPA: hypothetical protein VE397_10490 [Stellaceae bacterium]|nr:hypothetical protein [Stellaceae bacterium]
MLRPAAADRAQLLPALIVVSIFVPEAFGFFLFDLRLTIARALLLVAMPVIVFSLGGLLGSSQYRFALSDLLFPVTAAWMILAEAEIDGLASAVKSGGVSALEFIGPYLAMRAFVRTGSEAQRIAVVFCVAAAIAGFLGILDPIFHEHVLREGLARITGYKFFFYDRASDPLMDYRLGFLRSQGPLEQPIIYGVVMCYALLLTRVLSGRKKLLCRVGCGIGLFLCASSAPWEALVIGIGLAYYCRFVPFSAKWSFLTLTGALAASIVWLATVNPLGWIFNHFTLDASTGYFRMMIWDAAGSDVMTSPIFGIGATLDWFRPNWMSSTVDSLWLRAAMLFGIPGSILIALSVIGACSLPVRRGPAASARFTDRDVVLAETLDILAFLTIFLGFTVFYWGSVWMVVALTAGLRAALGQIAAK